jgi:hypothetical protein
LRRRRLVLRKLASARPCIVVLFALRTRCALSAHALDPLALIAAKLARRPVEATCILSGAAAIDRRRLAATLDELTRRIAGDSRVVAP